ncbi:hypothetical protein MKW94_005910 [Papaver nudicaule]|uniref:RING-type domain-containing protein n=1 Tax=Papaver nudicaule TaxID=74823 RepID=A0AA41VLG7_PAPNU|nr:hypothetical protein [Papaver nudicaule]
MANQKNTAIIITVAVVLFCIIIIKLIRIIIHRHFSTTTTTTTTTSPPLHIIHSPQQIHHHSLRFLFHNTQISPQTPHNQINQLLINSLPTFKFDSITGISQSTSTATLDCAICITKFEKQDELRLLPNCSHVFHSVCIDQWILLSNHNCPICRSAVINGGDDDNELKMMISNSSRSFRVEIGSVSLSRRIDGDEISVSAGDFQNRSYSLGSFEYWIRDFDAEVFVELERRNKNPAQPDDIRISVGDDCGGGMDEDGGATEVVIENRAEPDDVASYARSLSIADLQFSDRFYGGSERRTGGNGGGEMDVGGGGGGGRVSDWREINLGDKFQNSSVFSRGYNR